MDSLQSTLYVALKLVGRFLKIRFDVNLRMLLFEVVQALKTLACLILVRNHLKNAG